MPARLIHYWQLDVIVVAKSPGGHYPCMYVNVKRPIFHCNMQIGEGRPESQYIK